PGVPSDIRPTPRMWQPHIAGRIIDHPVATTHGRMMRPRALTQLGPTLTARLNHPPRPRRAGS
ncbi:hypothetical protein, partial [Streptomyces palmae]